MIVTIDIEYLFIFFLSSKKFYFKVNKIENLKNFLFENNTVLKNTKPELEKCGSYMNKILACFLFLGP